MSCKKVEAGRPGFVRLFVKGAYSPITDLAVSLSDMRTLM